MVVGVFTEKHRVYINNFIIWSLLEKLFYRVNLYLLEKKTRAIPRNFYDTLIVNFLNYIESVLQTIMQIFWIRVAFILKFALFKFSMRATHESVILAFASINIDCWNFISTQDFVLCGSLDYYYHKDNKNQLVIYC